ncbi:MULTISPECIES: hydantoinase/oxoprolinase family protein [unclassified Methylophaga]|jgi:probable H4MPT-linked C1 transfer pathway protein|uniref:hydantoinase/oxoprolinase family protein n=2 Tax=Methylophaga TaxID=40222 RepID=UPI000C8F9A01|nr:MULTISPECIES: hydantoinase/oxoprolinase family protein [unclassified Methylophaga]MAK66811.1 H4MPT-linked C1 transfer pathway protein [Methylophaga sp.]MAY17620.1 H4MPT-linked C1 transfer pathway protein [Methylophaga sp.]HAO25430.1 H4MPT-linked C1 transfer pathway protein [Methylophaga sp.]|tara:strand:+ start:2025 stop:3068 length:1044 start_codon:yes stop_codon:yes gene_type:complete
MHRQEKGCFSGWDIGGAHLKVVRCDNDGQLLQAIELPCPLWHGKNALRKAIRLALDTLNNELDQQLITMTGELADCFTDRAAGVSEILACIAEYFPADRVSVFSKNGWLSQEEARINWDAVASMNWLASAQLAAAHYPTALLIDCGSTTTDIMTLVQSLPELTAYDDQGRLNSGELLYTGVIRTPLMAVSRKLPFRGQWQTMAAELFATTGDCWRILDEISAAQINDKSADGNDWSIENCQRRLARMLGTDANLYSAADWKNVAHWFTEQQVQQIHNACLQVLSAHPDVDWQAPVIGAGTGRFVTQLIASRLQRPYVDFDNLLGTHETAAAYAPASALALLAQRQFT